MISSRFLIRWLLLLFPPVRVRGEHTAASAVWLHRSNENVLCTPPNLSLPEKKIYIYIMEGASVIEIVHNAPRNHFPGLDKKKIKIKCR